MGFGGGARGIGAAAGAGFTGGLNALGAGAAGAGAGAGAVFCPGLQTPGLGAEKNNDFYMFIWSHVKAKALPAV